ncbi:MAG: hypothetical protein ACJAYB_000028 [Psychromonas sp.]|jgi:hypothetical protein
MAITCGISTSVFLALVISVGLITNWDWQIISNLSVLIPILSLLFFSLYLIIATATLKIATLILRTYRHRQVSTTKNKTERDRK